MSKRVDETDEEYLARHRERERQRRETPEWQAKNKQYKQTPEYKARHAERERERRKTKQVQAYDREYRREYRDKNREKVREYAREFARRPDQVEKRKAWAQANKHKNYDYQVNWFAKDPRHGMFVKTRSSAKARGIEFSITEADIYWPTHCPIFGIELQYDRDRKTPHRDNYPTFDRWDNSKGYVPGNVFVISWLANRMKWHSTVEQLEALVRYMKVKPQLTIQ